MIRPLTFVIYSHSMIKFCSWNIIRKNVKNRVDTVLCQIFYSGKLHSLVPVHTWTICRSCMKFFLKYKCLENIFLDKTTILEFYVDFILLSYTAFFRFQYRECHIHHWINNNLGSYFTKKKTYRTKKRSRIISWMVRSVGCNVTCCSFICI